MKVARLTCTGEILPPLKYLSVAGMWTRPIEYPHSLPARPSHTHLTHCAIPSCSRPQSHIMHHTFSFSLPKPQSPCAPTLFPMLSISSHSTCSFLYFLLNHNTLHIMPSTPIIEFPSFMPRLLFHITLLAIKFLSSSFHIALLLFTFFSSPFSPYPPGLSTPPVPSLLLFPRFSLPSLLP